MSEQRTKTNEELALEIDNLNKQLEIERLNRRIDQGASAALKEQTAPSKIVAGLLAIFLGAIGIHKFYLGKTGQGFIYLIFCWTWIPAIIAFFEGISYFFAGNEAWGRKYGRR